MVELVTASLTTILIVIGIICGLLFIFGRRWF
jgi:hypothetical protein